MSCPALPPFGTEALGCCPGVLRRVRTRRHGGACRPPQTPHIRSCRSPAPPGNCRGPCRPGGHTGEATFLSPPGLGPLPTSWPLRPLLGPWSVPASHPAAPLGLLAPVCVGASRLQGVLSAGSWCSLPDSSVLCLFPSKPDCLCLKSVVHFFSLSELYVGLCLLPLC